MTADFDMAILGPIGTTELLIIGVVALLIFGARLPSVARSMGKSIVEFKKGLREVKGDMDEAAAEASQKTLPQQDQPGVRNPALEAEATSND